MSDEIKFGNVGSATTNVQIAPSVTIDCSPFVADEDMFDVSVRFYKDGKKFIVEGSDDVFDDKRDGIQTLTLSIKYPSQGDTTMIGAQIRQLNGNIKPENLNVSDYLQVEVVRFLNLVKKWNMTERLNNENVMNLSPKIIKAILDKIRAEIGIEGII